MSPYTVHTAETAPEGSRPLLQGLHKAFGFVPNLFAVISESPSALAGALALGDAFSKTSLTPTEQQLVAIAVSEANDCTFCVAAHSTIAKRMVKADPALVAAARNRTPLPDPKLDALVAFTRKVVESRGFVADAELAAFFAAGYSKAQAIEVLLGVGMKTFNNYVDHIAHTPLNDQFKPEAWEPKSRAA